MDDDDTAPMAASVAQPWPPPPRAAVTGTRRGFFAFLKDRVLVTTRNRGLFLPLVAAHAARSLLPLLAARIVALRYSGPTLGGLKANDGEDGGLPVSALLDKLLDGGHWWLLLLAGAACLVREVAFAVLGLAIQVATTTCSAAASIEGGRTTTLTLACLLGKVRRNLRGPMATAVFVKLVRWASFVAWMLVTVTLLAAVDASASLAPAALVALLLHLTVTPLVFIYGVIACEVAVVVSVAEPGLRAGGALRRACRLTRGWRKVAQAALHELLSEALNKAVWRMYDVAVAHGVAAAAAPFWFWLGAVVVSMLVGAVKVLYTATVTAYYFDCKRTEEEKAEGHIHVE